MSFHVRRRICFRISFLLCFLQHFVEVGAFHIHFVHHVIGGPVQDPRDLVDHVPCQRSIQSTDDRNPSAAACFKKIVDVLFSGDLHQFTPMLRHQCFVGCADTLSCQQGLFCKLISRPGAAHHFGHDLNLRILKDHVKIMDKHIRNRISREVPQIQNIFDLYLFSGVFSDPFSVGSDHLKNA